MSISVDDLGRITNESLMIRELRQAADITVVAYEDKKQWQLQQRSRMNAALNAQRGRPKPARSIEDDPSLYDEGQMFPIQIAVVLENSPQRARPIRAQLEHWEIHGLESRLYLTQNCTFAREMPSIIKARTMTKELHFDHPLVLGQYRNIIECLKDLRGALHEV